MGWDDPAWVDRQMARMAGRWKDEAFRRRQLADIVAGRRNVPLEKAPSGTPCGAPVNGSTCGREDTHAFHVTVTGSASDGSLHVHGRWDGDVDG